ncbi:MAG: tetratricopeptide repeat protein [bacterium]
MGFCLTAPRVHGQDKASEWLKIGLEASNYEVRVQSYEKAIQIDPDLIEAYYLLGLAHKSQGQYEQAELILNKAYFKNPFALSNKIKSKILFELGRIYYLQDKVQKARDALQGAKELSQKKLRGKICYELGQLFLKEGEIDQALEELRQGKRLAPQDASMFDTALNLAESKKAINEKYKQSVSLMHSERFEQAGKLLDEIIAVDPDFKDVQQKRQEVNRLSERSKVQKELVILYNRAKRHVQKKEIPPAIKLYQQIVQTDSGFRDAAMRLSDLQTATAEQTKLDETRTLYDQGVAAFNNQNWRSALNAFRQVQEIDSMYRDVAALSAQARSQLAQQATAVKKKARLRAQAEAFVEAQDWPNAINAFESLKKAYPAEADLDAKISKIKKALSADAQLEVTDIETLYEEGVLALQNSDWQKAAAAFEKVALLDSAYRDVQNKLADARFNFNKKRTPALPPAAPKEASQLIRIGILAALLLILVAGIWVASHTVRARFYYWRKQYAKSTAIYEKKLARNPGLIKLYTILAELYLIQDRRDHQALKVFETILKLNIFTDHKKEIQSIVANQYMEQGRTDISAIQIMERELNLKINNPNPQP